MVIAFLAKLSSASQYNAPEYHCHYSGPPSNYSGIPSGPARYHRPKLLVHQKLLLQRNEESRNGGRIETRFNKREKSGGAKLKVNRTKTDSERKMFNERYKLHKEQNCHKEKGGRDGRRIYIAKQKITSAISSRPPSHHAQQGLIHNPPAVLLLGCFRSPSNV
jgi:hypothetical protein